MEAFINQPYIERRVKISRYATWGGLGALVVGLFLAQRSIIFSYASLLAGMVGAMVGAHYTSTYVREPRADQVFAHQLDGLDKRYALYCYYLPSNYVVASHYGLTVLLPKAQKGEVTLSKGQWKHKAGLRKLMQFVGEPSLGNPERELATEIKAVEEWLARKMPQLDVPVHGVVVFTHPEVILDAQDSAYPAMVTDKLAEYLKQGMKGQPTLSTANQKEMRRTLDTVVAGGKHQ